LLRKITGLPSPSDFGWGNIFTLKFGNRTGFNDYLNCGGTATTPALNEISARWPVPRAFSRIVLLFALALAGFWFTAGFFGNMDNSLEMNVGGAMAFSIAYAMFFFDLNVPRNISLFEVVQLIIFGGILSQVTALLIYELLPYALPSHDPWIAGFVEEPAKLIAAVVLAGWIRDFKWTLNGVLAGAAIGAGFGALENVGYLYSYIGWSPKYVLEPIWLRGISGLLHVLLTGATVGALWRAKGNAPFTFSLFVQSAFVRVFLLAMGLHAANNWLCDLSLKIKAAPVQWFLPEVQAVLLVFAAYLTFSVAQMGLNEIREAQAAELGSERFEEKTDGASPTLPS
jgi:RsiW-degrading membrane proteinase PrsW (M82 family)